MRLYKIKLFYAKFGITLDVENLEIGQVNNQGPDSEDEHPQK